MKKLSRIALIAGVAASLIVGTTTAASAQTFSGDNWTCTGTRSGVVVGNAYGGGSVWFFPAYTGGGAYRTLPAVIGINTYQAGRQSFSWTAGSNFSSAYATCIG